MLRLKFNLEGTKITRYDEAYPIARTQEYLYADFEFNASWDGMSKFAEFSTDGLTWVKRAIGIDGECLVPWEVIILPSFKVKVVGKSNTSILNSGEIEIAVRGTGKDIDLVPNVANLKPTDENFYEFEVDAVGSLVTFTFYREGGSLSKQLVLSGGGSGSGETITSFALNGNNLVLTTDLRTLSVDLSSLAGEGGITEEEVDAKVAALKLEVDRNAADLNVIRNANYQTEAQVDAKIAEAQLSGGSVDLSAYSTTAQVDAKDAVVLQSAKDYTYSQAEIDSKVAAGGIFDPTAYDTSAVVDGKISTAVDAIVVPTNTSDLTNDSGFITASDIPSVEVPTKVSDLENDSKYQTDTDVAAAIAEAALSGGEVDLSAYPKVTEVFTNSTKTEIKNDLFVATDSESTKVTSQDILNLAESNEEDLTQLEDDLNIERDVVSGEITKNPVKELMANAEEEFDNSDALEDLLGIEFKEEAGSVVASVIASGDNVGVIGEIQNNLTDNATKIQQIETQQNTNTTDISNIKSDYVANSDIFLEGEINPVYLTTLNAKVDDVASASLKRTIVTVLPTEDISDKTIYMVLSGETIEGNLYDEYMYINDKWEVIGSTNIDLTDYALKSEVPTIVLKTWDGSNIEVETE